LRTQGRKSKLAVDFLLVGASVFLLCASLLGAYTAKKLHRSIRIRFFQYVTYVFVCIAVLSITYIVTGFFNDPTDYDMVKTLQYYISPFSYLAIAFIIAAMESVKSEKRTSLYNFGFLIAGYLSISLFAPDAYTLAWTDIGWQNSYSIEFEFGRVLLLVLAIIAAIPLATRSYHNLHISVREDIKTPIAFWIIIIVLPTILTLQPFRSIAPSFLQPLYHLSVIMVAVAFFFLMLTILFRNHPTILFAGTHEIDEIYIITQGSGLPLYHYNFHSEESHKDPGLLSAFFTSIRHFVKHSLGSGEIERIQIGEYELHLQEGVLTYGILITKESTELAKNLLALSVSEFEAEFGFNLDPSFIETKQYESFDKMIAKYFEFAITRKK